MLTPQQAMADMVRLTKVFKEELGCAQYDRSSERYCPVISVGGSYPGFLSAMLRIVYPDFVDISYASSAPLKLYDGSASQYAYYDIVTKAVERLSKGCAKAVRKTLEGASKDILESNSMEEAQKKLNMCVNGVPDFIRDVDTLNENVMLSVTYAYAGYDMVSMSLFALTLPMYIIICSYLMHRGIPGCISSWQGLSYVQGVPSISRRK